MKNWVYKNWLYMLGMVVGAFAGFLYWQQVGCNTGTCLITSKPVNSTIYGAIMGAFLFGIFRKESKRDSTIK